MATVSFLAGKGLSLAGTARRVGAGALDLLLPPRCLSCGAITADTGTLCQECWTRITFVSAPLCACCGRPFALDPGMEARCGLCLAHPPPYDRARAAFSYDEASRGLVLRFKHADATGAAPAFARWMARAGGALLEEADLIVPVPLHRWRLLRRRYNQAALLAMSLARASHVPCLPDALVRARPTPSQGTMGRRDRRGNVRGAFRLANPQAVSGRRVLLIDDVLTSGATVGECARVLRAGGATSVDVLTLARVTLGDA